MLQLFVEALSATYAVTIYVVGIRTMIRTILWQEALTLNGLQECYMESCSCLVWP